MSNLSHEFACGSGERGLNRVFTCGVYKCPALLHKWPHKQPVARLGLEQYSVQMRIISPQLTIRPPPAKLWPSSITSWVSLICLLGQLACAWQPDKDIIFRPDFRFHSAGSDVPIKGPGSLSTSALGGARPVRLGKNLHSASDFSRQLRGILSFVGRLASVGGSLMKWLSMFGVRLWAVTNLGRPPAHTTKASSNTSQSLRLCQEQLISRRTKATNKKKHCSSTCSTLFRYNV